MARQRFYFRRGCTPDPVNCSFMWLRAWREAVIEERPFSWLPYGDF